MIIQLQACLLQILLLLSPIPPAVIPLSGCAEVTHLTWWAFETLT